MAPLQVSQRHANSHAIVNGGFCATLDASQPALGARSARAVLCLVGSRQLQPAGAWLE